jgi:hypothetical protein
MERPLEKFHILRLITMENEGEEILDKIENERHRQDLKSVLNKKAYNKYELEQVMLEEAVI